MLNTFGYMKSDSDTIIYDHIEVVRGATGLTTGAGDPSATVNMVRKRPTAQWQAQTGVKAGSYDNYYSSTWTSAVRWHLTASCAGGRYWPTGTANPFATTTGCNGRSA